MRSLNLDQLRALREVVELGSFSAAARRLHLTQPTVSLQIRELEGRCGVRLVERNGKGARATAAGRELIVHAGRIAAETDHALAAMRRYKDGHLGRVHLGTGPTALAYLLPPVLQRLRGQYPNIDIVVTTSTTDDIAEQIRSNVLDLGLTALPIAGDDIVAVPVRRDEMVAILPATDAAIPSAVTPSDVARRTLILQYQRNGHGHLTRDWLRAAGVEARPAMEFSNVDAIKNAVAAGLGMALVPGPAVPNDPSAGGFVARPLDPPLTRTLGLVQRRNKPDSPALLAVREALLTLANIDAAESAGAAATTPS